jgi:pyruvate/2-oxoglutarate dehydrogenase complex dihydrolipoamide acyltransferase (E2) component
VFAASYFLDARNYVSTDNAQVDGDKIAVNAPASGTLIDWRANQGAELTEDQVVGRIKVNGGFVQPQQSIRAPADGTVAVDNGVEGAFVTAGTQLAIAYDFSKVYVTARVDETDIDAIHIGQRVDFTVDAFPGQRVPRLRPGDPGRRGRGVLAVPAVELVGDVPEGDSGDPGQGLDRRPARAEPGAGHERHGEDPQERLTRRLSRVTSVRHDVAERAGNRSGGLVAAAAAVVPPCCVHRFPAAARRG